MRKDLPQRTLVMCKASESEDDCWQLQHYFANGVTYHGIWKEDKWLYIVPLKYFNPTCTDWRPEEKYNWAKFGEG